MTELFRPIEPDELREWRRNLPKGWRREVATITSNAPKNTPHVGDEAIVERPARPRPMEGRQAVEAVYRDTMEWLRRVGVDEAARQLVASGRASHLSVDEAKAQIKGLLEKDARASVERVYAREGRNRAVILDGRA